MPDDDEILNRIKEKLDYFRGGAVAESANIAASNSKKEVCSSIRHEAAIEAKTLASVLKFFDRTFNQEETQTLLTIILNQEPQEQDFTYTMHRAKKVENRGSRDDTGDGGTTTPTPDSGN